MWGYGPESGLMGGWGAPVTLFHGIFWILVLALIIAGIVWLVRSVPRQAGSQMLTQHRLTGLDILEQRYARGEINREEYLQKKQDMSG